MPERFYGQQGEDRILYELFKEQRVGFYVDVGAGDGIRFSNTYIFEQVGWDGICIEPHPEDFQLLKKNRPKAVCLEAMAGELDGRGLLGTSVTSGIHQRIFNKKGDLDPSVIQVSLVKLDSVLERLGVSKIDLLSIDVEYSDDKVLQGIELLSWLPRVVVIEMDSQWIDKYFRKAGYVKARRHYFNSFFCRKSQDVEIICSVDPHMENGELL